MPRTTRLTALLLGALLALPLLAAPAAAAPTGWRFLSAVTPAENTGDAWRKDVVRLLGQHHHSSLSARGAGGGSSLVLAFDLGRRCDRLLATVGLDERQEQPAEASLAFSVELDGTPARTGRATAGRPQLVDLDVTGVAELRLSATVSSLAHAGLANPQVRCDGAPVVDVATGEPCTSSTSTYADVPPSSTHYRGVSCLTERRIARGTGAGTFSPDAGVTRGQMAAFLARSVTAVGGTLPASPPDAFDDDDGSAFEREANQLAAVQVVRGTGTRRYSPAATVTRAQMATFLVRAYEHVSGVPLASGPDYYSDTASAPGVPQISKVTAAGIAAGTTGGAYEPAGTVSRGQMATFLSRLLVRWHAIGRTAG